jgi:hypothetical protein
MLRKMFAVSAAILLALLFFALAPQISFADDPPCGLVKDCSFSDFYNPDGACSGAWKCFYVSAQHPGIGLSQAEGGRTIPSVIFKTTNAAFDAGLYQQVAVTPGVGYRFNILWAVERLNAVAWQDGYQINRKVGIDGTGGTDPNSPAIKWSPDYFGSGKFTDEDIVVSEYARAATITVFIRVMNPYDDKVAEVYIDSASLIPNTDMPPIQVAPPTPTSAPTLPPPTTKHTREAQPTQEATTPPEPTDSPSPTLVAEEPTASVAEPTTAARPTRTRVAQVQPTVRATRTRVSVAQNSSSASNNSSQVSAVELGALGLLGLVGISVAILLVAAAAFLLLRRK